MGGYIGSRSVVLSTTAANVQDVTATDTTPEVTIVNTTHEDTDGGREGKVIFKGQQSGGEETTLAEIQGSHDGTADDEKGDLIFRTNDGSDGASPTEAMRISSGQKVGIGTNDPAHTLTINSADEDHIRLENGSEIGFIKLMDDGDINIWAHGSENIKFLNGTGSGTERMRIDSDGKVGIGTTTVESLLHLSNSDATAYSDTATDGQVGVGPTIYLENPANTNTTVGGQIVFGMRSTEAQARIAATGGTAPAITFGTNDAERMRIESSGNLVVGETTAASVTNGTGAYIASNGQFYASSSSSHFFNKQADGDVLIFRSAGVSEGSISISGSTTSYNGGHLSRWSQLTDGSEDTSIVKGTVMTNLDQMAVWSHNAVAATYYEEGDELPLVTEPTYYEDGDTIPEGKEIGDVKTEAVFAEVGDEKTSASDAFTEENEQLNCMAVSSVEGDPNVAGVFVNWDAADDGFNDMNVAMTGDMVIRIAKGVTIARGDLLMSAGDGTAKPQDDDIVRSKTIAKVTSTNVSHTYDDGSYCIPCVLMAC